MHRCLTVALVLSAMASGTACPADAATQTLPPPWLPSDPGKAQCETGKSGAELANGALRFAIAADHGALHLSAFDNGFIGAKHALKGELFSVLPRDGKPIDASRFHLEGALACAPIAANPDAARRADRLAGVALTAKLVDAETGLHVAWRALLRDGTSYVREELRFEADKTIDLASISLVDLDLDHAWVDGTASGSPVIADERYFGFEHPMAEANVIGDHATMTLKRVLPLRAGVATHYSAVFGVVPRGQLRRGFQAYLENERATPFRTFLHYNSWYDIGYFTPYTEAEAVERINAFGQKLVRERGVTMDSFLFDDGWDDHSHLWQFSKDFPHGFTPLEKAAAKFGAAPGVWLSPWGGYGPPRKLRLAAARKAGYTVDDQGIALSGPKYYELFHDVAMRLLKKYGINQFKLDGTGSPDKVTPGSAFDSDFAAAIALIHDLRAVKPDLFINLTTNTWPSPFWLRTADSIWRGGWDHAFAGVGDNRQRWITYRDADTYGGIVRQGPLFPLNSLMLHGIIYAQHAKGLARIAHTLPTADADPLAVTRAAPSAALNVLSSTPSHVFSPPHASQRRLDALATARCEQCGPDSDPGNDFADEVRSYFATGTGLQEMYITPDLLTDANWNDLATAAKWARENAATLRDSHWIGGDPARGEVYGWAAWRPGHAIITLRNPSDQPQRFALNIGKALELPDSAAREWTARDVYDASSRPRSMRADNVVTLTLRPFALSAWSMMPTSTDAR